MSSEASDVCLANRSVNFEIFTFMKSFGKCWVFRSIAHLVELTVIDFCGNIIV